MYYEKIAVAVTACALVATVVGASHRNWTAEAREPFHYVFSNDKTLDVENVNGTIQVIGDNGNSIRAEGERIVRAEDQQAIDRARKRSSSMSMRRTASPSSTSTAHFATTATRATTMASISTRTNTNTR